MPICDKPSQAAANKNAATEVDDHASEAAKMRRTREQAYFNSYDFDAIEVLPYDEDEDGDQRKSNWANQASKSTIKYGQPSATILKGAMSSQRQHKPTTIIPMTKHTQNHPHHSSKSSSLLVSTKNGPTIGASINSSATSSISESSCSSAASRDDGRYSNGGGGDMMMLTKYSYLQRLGAFLIKTHHDSRVDDVKVPVAVPVKAVNGPQPLDVEVHESVTENQLEHGNGEGITKGNGNGNGNFLLPRAMLKYQSVGVANSMPVAATAVCAITPTPPPSPAPPTSTSSTAAAAPLPLAIGQGNRHLLGVNASNNNNNNNGPNNKPTTADDHKTATRMMMTTSTNNNNNSSSNKVITMNGNGALRAPPPLPALLQPSPSAASLPYQDGHVALTAPTKTGVLGKKLSTSSTLTTTTTASTSSSSSTSTCEASNVNDCKTTKGKAVATASLIPGMVGMVECAPTPRGRTSSHQSHYSTDKSGSSGYYSSNVCSTYSLEDHIYCEPHIDVLEVNTTASGKGSIDNNNNNNKTMARSSHARRLQQLTNLPPPPLPLPTSSIDLNQQATLQLPVSRKRDMTSAGSGLTSKQHHVSGDVDNQGDGDDDDDDDDDDDRDAVVIAGASKGKALAGVLTPVHFNYQLRVLETSIENLDRHLKNFPGVLGTSQDHTVSYVQTAFNQPPHLMGDMLRPHHYLPTIMEGLDQQQSPQQRQSTGNANQIWRPDQETAPDDSLMDIDLDSFLLVNERQKYTTKQQTKHLKSSPVRGGIDNPNFLTDEQEENHYKCAKYINSCPEDAYRVESDIVAPGTSNGSVKSSTIDHYLKRYEDQIHFQNTRELLEDVRDKIRLLAHKKTSANTNYQQHSHKNAGESNEVPRELEGMIKTLQTELETYLERMNRHSELEIRQLYSGMVKNQNVVKMKKAFERRRPLAVPGVEDCDFTAYEAIQDGILMTASGVPLSIRQQVTSIRCASDPNFKMKRKSLAEIFPLTDCYMETTGGSGGGMSTNAEARSQMQRNLSYHKPVLNKFDSQVGGPNGGGADIGSGGGGRGGIGSGGGSNEGGSAEKDSINEWHSKKPSIWEMYYGTNRLNQSLLGKRSGMVLNPVNQGTMSYPSSRPESDFTLDLPRAEQLRIKMEKEKKFRQRCRYITTFLSLVFFLLTVMVVSLVLTRGKRMFGSMI